MEEVGPGDGLILRKRSPPTRLPESPLRPPDRPGPVTAVAFPDGRHVQLPRQFPDQYAAALVAFLVRPAPPSETARHRRGPFRWI